MTSEPVAFAINIDSMTQHLFLFLGYGVLKTCCRTIGIVTYLPVSTSTDISVPVELIKRVCAPNERELAP